MGKETTTQTRLAGPSFYGKVAKGLAKKFGKDSIAYRSIKWGISIKGGVGSHPIFNTAAGFYLPEGQRVATFDDLGSILEAEESFLDREVYTDTSEFVLRSEIPSDKRNAEVLKRLVEQARRRGLEFSRDNPLLLSGLTLTADDNHDNPYGVLLNITRKTKAVNDPRFAYRNNRIKLGNAKRTLRTKRNGLSWICISGDGVVDSSYDYLLQSNGYGRVVIFDASPELKWLKEDPSLADTTDSDLASRILDLGVMMRRAAENGDFEAAQKFKDERDSLLKRNR